VENAGIDFWFLRHIGVEPETQRRIQGFYQRWFAECERVVDLACGDGDFLGLLREQGIEVLGVDSDPECCTAARARGVNATCQDVFDFLHAANESSYDGIFSAHLVEHLPYERVIELFRLAWRALKPGGVIVVTTPNVRGLYTHLESFYLHFGHVSFYHPELLCFFLKQSGLSNDSRQGARWCRPSMFTTTTDTWGRSVLMRILWSGTGNAGRGLDGSSVAFHGAIQSLHHLTELQKLTIDLRHHLVQIG